MHDLLNFLLKLQSRKTAYHYETIADAFKQIYRNEGLRGFYRGLGVSYFGLFHVMIQFPLYEKTKIFLFEYQKAKKPEQKDLDAGYVLLASTLSKLLAGLGAYPHEVIRTKLQNQTPGHIQYNGVIDVVTQIVKREGIRGLYRGLGTNLLRITPSGAITLFCYETFKRQFDKLDPPRDRRKPEHIARI